MQRDSSMPCQAESAGPTDYMIQAVIVLIRSFHEVESKHSLLLLFVPDVQGPPSLHE
jgi:hypothetical protein